MKKFIAIAIAVLTVFSFTTVAFAESTTTLTTTVPDAEYTLNIPADQEIAFGTEFTDIGIVSITNSNGFAVGKNVRVEVSVPEGEDGYGFFTSEDVSTKIPFALVWSDETGDNMDDLGTWMTFKGKADGTVEEFFKRSDITVDHIELFVLEENWMKALAGEYSAIITFTAEVVAEEAE